MKRLLAVLALFVTIAVPISLATPTLASASRGTPHTATRPAHHHPHPPKCPRHGYTHAKCRKIHRRRWVGFHIPGYKHHQLEMYVGSYRHHAVFVVVAVVGCPSGAPNGAVCFRLLEYDAKTGKPIASFKTPTVFEKKAVWAYDPATGKFHRLSRNSYGRYQTHHPGLFAFIP